MIANVQCRLLLRGPHSKRTGLILPFVFLLVFSITLPAQVVEQKQMVKPVATAVVNFREVAAREALKPKPSGAIMGFVPNEAEYKEPYSPPISPNEEIPAIANKIDVASPSPVLNYQGAPDEAQGGGQAGIYMIPPDTYGAVGLDKVFVTLNNNYRIVNKATGAQLSLVSMPAFWAPLGAPDATNPFDPRIVYDPYNNRWILAAVSNGGAASSRLLLALSQTHDPEGLYNLYSYDPDPGVALWADFPMLGFNKNWIALSLNMFTVAGGVFNTSVMFVIDYPALRGLTNTNTLFNLGPGVFCVHPAETYSPTENVLYAPCHISSAAATYKLNTITGTPAAPIVTLMPGNLVRPGGAWTEPGGNVAPQICVNGVPPVFTCPSTPMGIDVGDAYIRSNVVFRNNAIWYSQAIGLPAGGVFTHVSVQWTKLNPIGGGVLDGGRIDVPTATDNNGEHWYTYPSISVNAANDALAGFTKTESDWYAGGAYAMRLAADQPGTMRDVYIYKEGLDYYEKTFGESRNRWGDFSHTMVDPLDDASFWTIQEYAGLRALPVVGGSYAKWGTWWAKVVPNACLSAVANGNWSAAGTWDLGAAPGVINHASILFGHNVTLDVDPNAASITVNSGGTLTINSARTLSCKLIVYGTLNITGGKLTLGTNDVFLAEGATLTGASSTSYFVTNSTGVLKKIIPGGGSFEFPVAPNTTSFNGLTIATSVGDPDEIFSVGVEAGLNPASPDNASCVQRTWKISEITAGGNNATLTFKWAAAEHGASFPGTSAFAYKHNGSNYVMASSMTVPALAGGIYSSSTVTSITSFSPWIVAGAAALPVVMDYFTGVKLPDGTHKLDWKANCSGSGARFELQRSGDSRNFTALNSINADYALCLQPFTYTDHTPLPGKNFYRIMAKDETGKIRFSHVILLLNSKSGFEILSLHPNPVANTAILDISVVARQTLKIYVTDSKGSRVMEMIMETETGTNQKELNFANLPSGTYLLTLVSDQHERRTIKFVR